ncbi:putative membrane protein [Ruegeria lacuscaerulensis ITI-1157]|nr:putative membrane protein [Ruegeria lacuscaerulensis ITI-1157]
MFYRISGSFGLAFVFGFLALVVRSVRPIRFFSAFVFLAGSAVAQGAGRTVVDFQVENDQVLLEITLNAEAFLTGLDPQVVAQGGESVSADYARLRRLPSSELEPLLHERVKAWKQELAIDANGSVALSYEGARIPVVGDPDQPRLSRILLAGPLPPEASELRLTWPVGFGPVVLRQKGVDAPYTGLLEGGETSPRISLRGGAGMGPQQAAKAYFKQGVARVVQGQMLLSALALVLVFLAPGVRPVLAQFAALTLGVLAALPLGVSRVVPSGEVGHWSAVAGTVAVLALWNLIGSRVRAGRLGAVFLAGSFLGLSLSSALAQTGMPSLHVVPALLAYSGGVLLAMASVAGLALAIMTVLLPDAARLRGRISTVASLMLAGLGLYWVALPVLPL